jgi:hypothetical protein
MKRKQVGSSDGGSSWYDACQLRLCKEQFNVERLKSLEVKLVERMLKKAKWLIDHDKPVPHWLLGGSESVCLRYDRYIKTYVCPMP